jgi:hypothetical protein
VITWDTLSTKTEEKKNTKSEARLLLGAARCTHIDLRYRYGQGSEVPIEGSQVNNGKQEVLDEVLTCAE